MSSFLAETALAFEQGDTPDLTIGPVAVRDPVALTLTPIDLTQAGIKVWLTAKKSRADTDANAVFQHTVGVGGGPGGITLNSPATADKNLATVRLTEADTTGATFTSAFSANIAAPVTLYYDVQLQEPDGRKTTVARGTITVTPQITRA